MLYHLELIQIRSGEYQATINKLSLTSTAGTKREAIVKLANAMKRLAARDLE